MSQEGLCALFDSNRNNIDDYFDTGVYVEVNTVCNNSYSKKYII